MKRRSNDKLLPTNPKQMQKRVSAPSGLQGGQMIHRKKKKKKHKWAVGDHVFVIGRNRGHGIIRWIGSFEKDKIEFEQKFQEEDDHGEGNELNENHRQGEKKHKKLRMKLRYGVELVEVNARGFHDGIVNGTRYFKCAEMKGVIVGKTALRPWEKNEKKIRHADRNNAQLFGNVFAQLFAERVDTHARRAQRRAARKLGPREVGRVRNWFGADEEYDMKEDGSSFLEWRGTVAFRPTNIKPADKKLGPRDMGKPKGFRSPKWKIRDNSEFLEDTPSYVSSKGGKAVEPVPKKLGPRDMGKVKGFRSPRWNESSQSSKKKQEVLETTRKLGPREMGRVQGWKGAKYEEGHPKKIKQKANKEDIRKLGPREIGKVKGWKGAQYPEH